MGLESIYWSLRGEAKVERRTGNSTVGKKFGFSPLCSNIALLFRPPRPLRPPTYFLCPHELTAPEGQMNSTFLPSWAVSGPHTAKACLINETQQDMGSCADSFVRNNVLETKIQWEMERHLPTAHPPTLRGPHGAAVVNHNCVASIRVMSGDVVRICCSWVQMKAGIQSEL